MIRRTISRIERCVDPIVRRFDLETGRRRRDIAGRMKQVRLKRRRDPRHRDARRRMKSEQRLRTLESPQGERASRDSELETPQGDEPATQASPVTAMIGRSMCGAK
jgi:hypothetical protein